MADISRARRNSSVQPGPHAWLARFGNVAVHLLATMQVVWFYLENVPSAMHLLPYEQGSERTPFQYRLLLAGPLAWAHSSALLGRVSMTLTGWHAWFGHSVYPEDLVEAAIDVIAVGITGLAGRSMYRLASPTGILLAAIYPLTLIMVTGMYVLLNVHAYRFVYDLPGTAFFSMGLYLIYARRSTAYFVLLFCVATLNRETTLLLLLFFIVAECSRGDVFDFRRVAHWRTLAVVAPLSMAWLGWHLWVIHHYVKNPSAVGPRVELNLALLAIPLAWPQLFGVYGYLLPAVLAGWRTIPNPILRNWLLLFPIWVGIMLWYGLFIEIRIFGELVAYFSCVAALIFEANVLQLLHHVRQRMPETAKV